MTPVRQASKISRSHCLKVKISGLIFQYVGPNMGNNRPKTRFAHAQKSICLKSKSLAHLVFPPNLVRLHM